MYGKAEVELELIGLVIEGKKIDPDSDAVKRKKGAPSTTATAEVKPGAVEVAEVAASVKSIGAAALGAIAVLASAPERIGKDGRVANPAKLRVRHFQRILEHLIVNAREYVQSRACSSCRAAHEAFSHCSHSSWMPPFSKGGPRVARPRAR